MALINQSIPSLFNGVSQQPAQLRLPSQCELSDNFYPTIATGLAKRPCTKYRAKLSPVSDNNAYVSIINRDSSERYVLMIRNGSLNVFDATTGAEKTVTFPDGTSYLGAPSPKTEFSAVTIADHTFIVNKTRTVSMGLTTSAAPSKVGYVSFAYAGVGVKRSMYIHVDGAVRASYATGDQSTTVTQTETIVSSMVSQLQSSLGAGWAITSPYPNLIRIENLSSSSWALDVSDDYGNSTMKAIKGSVQLFSDLPQQLDDGYVCYITQHPTEQGRGYYVRYSAPTKSYVETVGPSVALSLDASTMPHKLVRNADGTFTLSKITWTDRQVGDEESNPAPSFVGRKINDLFFYRNRFGFLSDENVILSTAGDYFNLFVKTATAVVDTDPIDESVAGMRVSILNYAVPFNKVLMLFSENGQFQLSAGDVLSPRTVKVEPVTEFSSSTRCRPVGAGQELFFVTNRPGHSGVREYFIEQDTLANDAADITAHVPAYVPAGAFRLAASTSEDALFVLCDNEPNAIYGYKYYWGKDEKVQSAWFRFRLTAEDTIMGCEFVGAVAYLVIGRSDGVYLEEINLQPGEVDPGLTFSVLLDRKVPLTGTYDANTNTTTWELPWPFTGTVYAVLGASFGSRAGAAIPLTQAGQHTASAAGNLSAGSAYVGVNYEARFRFSEQYVKDDKGNPIAAARVKLRRMLLSFLSTGYFRVEVTPPARDTLRYIFTGKVLGVSGITLGAPALSSGTRKFPIMTDSRGVTIDIVNDTPLPSTFQSAEWEGEVVVQAAR